MKKILAVVLACFLLLSVLCGCGEKSSNVTLEDVTEAIQSVDSSFAFDSEEKPVFAMIGAKDGWIGYINGAPVKVYEYENNASYEKAVEDYGTLIESWPKAGNFVLECNLPDVTTAFENLAK